MLQMGEYSARQQLKLTSMEDEVRENQAVTSEVNKLANTLKSQGVEKGDRVTIFMAHVPENWWVRGDGSGMPPLLGVEDHR